jgi:serine/threonine-protein kinase
MQNREKVLDLAADTIVQEPKGHAYASTVISDPGVDVSAPESHGWDDTFSVRYTMRAMLGEGGMGEVRLCKDARVGREVALKVVRPGNGSRSDLARRFVREARVQGQLEHPAVVPVYDLGRDPAGAAYFTMKRICGNTLEAILEEQRRNNEHFVRHFNRRKLLTAFNNVCLAVHYAHSRGVVHRDLKPANIMLCDFGEVYVLDWGLAKVGTTPETPAAAPLEGQGGDTAYGAIMGTPGYMAPEQVRGEPEKVDARTDIYALGAILFELLALEPLHRGTGSPALLASTLQAADARASERAPARDVPPELDAICTRATALAPLDRYESARELSEDIERFLDGDRDLERRRELAEAHASAALTAGSDALTRGDHSLREKALAEAGRAIALNPTNADALGMLMRLMTQPPREMPPEAKKELEDMRWQSMRISSKTAALGYGSFLLYVLIAAMMDIHISWWGGGKTALWMLAAALMYWSSRRPKSSGWVLPVTFLIVAIATAGVYPMFGPLILVPTIAAAITTGNVVAAPRSMRPWLTALGCATILVPLALELLGIVPSGYLFENGTMIVLPRELELRKWSSLVFLTVTAIGLVLTSALFVWRLRNALDAAEERLVVQSWQLRQLVPKAAHGGMSRPPPVDPSICVMQS